MKSSSKLVFYMLAVFLVFLVYIQVRQGGLRKVRDELRTTRSTLDKLADENREIDDLHARFSIGADVPVFVEKMHRQAMRIGIIDDYELSSSLKNTGGRNRISGGRDNGQGLSVSRIKISLRGEFRDVAEYLRLLQEDDSPKELINLKMVQEKGVPRLTMNLDIYSYGVNDGA